MSADDLMDARLREAGDRWRAGSGSTVLAVSEFPDVADLQTSETRRTRRRRWTLLSTAAAVAAVGGVAAALVVTHGGAKPRPAGPGSTPLVGTVWSLVSATDYNARAVSLVANPTLTVNADGSFDGNDGCNDFSGHLSIAANTLVLDPGGMAITEIGCTNSRADLLARTVDGILDPGRGNVGALQPLRYSLAGGRLKLARAGSGSLVYEALTYVKVTDPAELAGVWQLDGYAWNSTDTATSEPLIEKTTVTFDGKGGLLVQHLCYGNRGDVAITPGSLDISHVVLAGANPCPAIRDQQAAQEQNGKIDQLLTGRAAWFIRHGNLTISRGSTELDFIRLARDAVAYASSSSSGP